MKKFKHITVPGDIEVKDPLNKEAKGDVIDFHKFVVALLTDKRFSGGYQNVKAALAVEGALETCTPGAVVALEVEAWRKLKETVEDPSDGHYNIALNAVGLMQLLPFMDAILDAGDKPPVLEAVKEE